MTFAHSGSSRGHWRRFDFSFGLEPWSLASFDFSFGLEPWSFMLFDFSFGLEPVRVFRFLKRHSFRHGRAGVLSARRRNIGYLDAFVFGEDVFRLCGIFVSASFVR